MTRALLILETEPAVTSVDCSPNVLRALFTRLLFHLGLSNRVNLNETFSKGEGETKHEENHPLCPEDALSENHPLCAEDALSSLGFTASVA